MSASTAPKSPPPPAPADGKPRLRKLNTKQAATSEPRWFQRILIGVALL